MCTFYNGTSNVLCFINEKWPPKKWGVKFFDFYQINMLSCWPRWHTSLIRWYSNAHVYCFLSNKNTLEHSALIFVSPLLSESKDALLRDLSSKMRVFTVCMDPELNRIKLLIEAGERSADVSKYSHKMAKRTWILGPFGLRISWTRSRRCPKMCEFTRIV